MNIQRETQRIGSTLKGIGPTYTDKTGRNGLRIGDIIRPNFKELYTDHLQSHLKILKCYDFLFDLKEYEKDWFEGIEFLKKFNLVNSEYLINDLITREKENSCRRCSGDHAGCRFWFIPFCYFVKYNKCRSMYRSWCISKTDRRDSRNIQSILYKSWQRTFSNGTQ